MINRGFRLLWSQERPSLQREPVHFPLPPSPQQATLLDQQVSEMVGKDAIEVVSNPSSPGFYSRLFAIPKASGGFRPILDLSPLNKFLRKVKFRMDSSETIRREVRPNDWASSLDLKDAYFHIKIHPADRKWLRFTWRGMVYQFKVLPFGLSLAPWAFTRVVKDLVAVCRPKKIRLHTYLDDWLILASREATCRSHMSFLRNLASKLGFVIHEEKSDFSPSQEFVYLGMLFKTVPHTVQPSQARISSLVDLIKSTQSKHLVPARQLAAVLGKMESLAPLLPLGRLHKRPLQRAVASSFNQAVDSWNKPVNIQPWFTPSVAQWRVSTWLYTPVPITPPEPLVSIFTDASQKGWGAHMGQLTAHGTWPPAHPPPHINRLELEAVFRALSKFSPNIPPGHILIRSDNQTTVALINNQGGTHAPDLSRRSEQILLWAQSQGWSLSAKHIAGSANIMADLLSRPDKIIQTEWTLCHEALTQIWETWHKPLVDLFATKFSKRLPSYVSPVPDPQALQVDAMEMSWSGLQAYAFPPWSMLHQVAVNARKEGPSLILIAPYWPAKSWFPNLLSLSHCPPVPLRIRNQHLRQPRSGIHHGDVRTLNLHAWNLCGSSCSDEACQRTL